ncbi:hypothetical protein HK101_003404 [Irineochytrium annulatum]|nr:hypothetical protein HK101_003404 [Irineochytrium annulatum]
MSSSFGFLQSEPSLKERGRTAANDISDALVYLLNESSVGLYRVQEHVFKKVPLLVAEKMDLAAVEEQVALASSDLAEAQDLVAKMGRIQGFSKSIDRLNELHAVLEKKKVAA